MRIAFVVLLVMSWTAFGVAPASGCSCEELTAEQTFELAELVFIGRLVERTEISYTDALGVSLIFEVSEVHKGDVGRYTEVFTDAQESACGIQVPADTDVVLASSTWLGRQSVHLCLSLTGNDLMALGHEAQAPNPDIAPPEGFGGGPDRTLTLGALGILAIGAALFVVARYSGRDATDS